MHFQILHLANAHCLVHGILGSYKHAYEDVFRRLLKEKEKLQLYGSFAQLFENRFYEVELQ